MLRDQLHGSGRQRLTSKERPTNPTNAACQKTRRQHAAIATFSHPSAFTRAFKETFGLSPKDWQALAEQSKEREVQLLASPEPMQYLRPTLRR
jgi:AraC-like DNA-binding protein